MEFFSGVAVGLVLGACIALFVLGLARTAKEE